MSTPNLICVVGPTASGKTRLAVELAKALNGEVLSCDSMQIYRRMDIGTAKPTPEETQEVPHHMIDVIGPEEPFSVGRYVEMADPILQDILSRGKTCVLCGGTGLYVDSLMAGRTFAPYPETGRRQELEAMADREGIEAVLEKLRAVDPDSAERLHPGNRRRIIRAMEVYLETGKTITQHNLETQAVPAKYHPLWIGLDFTDRADLYRRIDRRVDLMMEDGLLDEIQRLLSEGVPPTATSLQAIGYKEPMAALRGEMTMEEAVEKVKQESRRYAKRQLTWFRRNKEIHWIMQEEPVDFQHTWQEVQRILEN
ncbi:MAG: tRNA (adenosine(37)-N6)-dimethylallyltransferase MiaA [Candidatus Avoscillospira sp.]